MDRFPWQTVKLLEGGLNGIDFVLICFLSLQITAAGAAVDGVEIGICHLSQRVSDKVPKLLSGLI